MPVGASATVLRVEAQNENKVQSKKFIHCEA